MTDSVKASPGDGTTTGAPPPGAAVQDAAWMSPLGRLALASLQTRALELSRLVQETADALARPEALLSWDSGGFAEIARRSVPRWHFAMLNDAERNEALVQALEKQIPAGALVLDIGTGTGFLAMAAVRAGAGHVYTCEENPLLAEIARQTVERHGMSGAVTVLTGRSTGLVAERDIGRRADVLISEIVDCGLIGEGLLPTLRHAREHLLAPDGIMIPVGARLYGQLIESDAVAGLNRAQSAADYDVSLMNMTATQGHFPVRLHTWPHRTLTEPVPLVGWDFRAEPLTPGSCPARLPATADGRADALVAWFSLDYGAGIVLGNAPEKTASHWAQALIPLERTVPVRRGTTAELLLRWSDTRLTAH
ncbi:50S ribosomal protein L11 methyltransferase [Actinacidiphila acididurans]|nr:50S ribosomal protein L11 methyltransferase [Actinacidiphila acididurans]